MDKVAGFEAGDLGEHHGEQGVACDIERHAEEDVSRALVKLTAKPATWIGRGFFGGRGGDIELEEAVAGGEGHVVDVCGVPGADDEAAGIGIDLDGVDELLDLVDHAAAGRCPAPPLLAVDGAQVAAFIRPVIPDADAIVLEILDVGITREEPQEFVDDRSQVQLLSCKAREAAPRSLVQVEPHLVTENGSGTGAGAVVAVDTVVQDVLQEVQVLAH